MALRPRVLQARHEPLRAPSCFICSPTPPRRAVHHLDIDGPSLILRSHLLLIPIE